jgi:3-oxoacyl-[acyl-carrier protein] reductase
MRTLQHQTALIICSGTGLGPEIAQRYAALGAQIILHTEKEENATRQVVSTIKSMGVKVTALSAETDNETELFQLFQNLKKQFKKINIIVIDKGQDPIKMPGLIREAARNIGDAGRIIFLTTVETADNEKTLNLISGIALEYASKNITVNAIIMPPSDKVVFDRKTEAGDIADAAEFFASDLSGLITGQYLIVNGTHNTQPKDTLKP